jgi:hypothetical protein
VDHHLRRLLVSVDPVRQGEQDVLARGGRDAELAVSVLADLQALQLGHVREPRERAERADPGGRQAVDIGFAGGDAGVGIRLRPEALVRAHRDRRAPAHLSELAERRLAHGLLDEVDVVLGESLEHAQRLRHRPVGVDVESQLGARAERVAQRSDHAQVVSLVEPDLEVEDLVARRQSRSRLFPEVVVAAAREVEEVRHVVAHGAAEQAPERLTGGLAADVGERHVDARPGEVARPGAELPQPEAERVGAHRVGVPGIAPDDEGRHGLHGGLDRGGIRAAGGLAPADQPVVGRHAHEDVGDAVARDDRADLAMPVGDVDDDGLDEGDVHSVCSNRVRISFPPARTTNTCSRRMPPKPSA